jgi:hypothetical protein
MMCAGKDEGHALACGVRADNAAPAPHGMALRRSRKRQKREEEKEEKESHFCYFLFFPRLS